MKTYFRQAICAVISIVLFFAIAHAVPKQGGQMIVAYKDDISTLDPQIGYDWQNLVYDQKPLRWLDGLQAGNH